MTIRPDCVFPHCVEGEKPEHCGNCLLDPPPEPESEESILAERDKYRAALEQIESGVLDDGDCPNLPTIMYVERILGRKGWNDR